MLSSEILIPFPNSKMEVKQFALLLATSIFCFSGVSSDLINDLIPDFLEDDFYHLSKKIAIEVEEITGDNVTSDEITYFLFTRSNPETYTQIDPANPEPLANPDVNIVFLVHGWSENRERPWYKDLKTAFLSRDEEYYVVQVDWSGPALRPYTVASWNTKPVGDFIAELLMRLNNQYSLPLENVLLVGHSLGGQVVGFTGKKVQEIGGQKLPRIVALDPAGPLFSNRPEGERLNENDAEVVQVVHTDGSTFGYEDSCGTIDFFPNGGSSQPGCLTPEVSKIVMCDHHRSWGYYIRAVARPDQFQGSRCENWEQFQDGQCENVQVAMGDLGSREIGNFYLETDGEIPYYKKSRDDGWWPLSEL